MRTHKKEMWVNDKDKLKAEIKTATARLKVVTGLLTTAKGDKWWDAVNERNQLTTKLASAKFKLHNISNGKKILGHPIMATALIQKLNSKTNSW